MNDELKQAVRSLAASRVHHRLAIIIFVIVAACLWILWWFIPFDFSLPWPIAPTFIGIIALIIWHFRIYLNQDDELEEVISSYEKIKELEHFR